MPNPATHLIRPVMFLREPYRVFFPLALVAGVAGVLLWPFHYHFQAALLAGRPGVTMMIYPSVPHARVMIEGLFGGFVAGFLGTALPRLLGVRPLRAFELVPVFGLWLAAVVFHLRAPFSLTAFQDLLRAGDGCFAAALAVLFLCMAARFRRREDLPPPGFPSALAGWLGAIVAAGLLAAVPDKLSPAGARFLQLLLYQGFPLLPVIGIAPFLLPHFFGHPSAHSLPESPRLTPEWRKRAIGPLLAAAAVLASFALEATDHVRSGHALRAVAVTLALAIHTPVFCKAKSASSLCTTLRIAVVSIAAGYLANLVHPLARIGNLHLALVSGLALFALAVGTRVTLGHAGRHDLLAGKLVFTRWLAGLALLAATTRMSADYLPKIMVSHHLYAAWTWVAVSALWLAVLAKFFLRTDEAPGQQLLARALPALPKTRRCNRKKTQDLKTQDARLEA